MRDGARLVERGLSLEPVLLDTQDAGPHSPKVAISSDGVGQVVWVRYHGARRSIWNARYEPGLGWTPAAPLETVAGGDVFAPHIATDGDGNSIALWHQATGAGVSVWSARYDRAQRSWQPAALLDDGDSADAFSPTGSAIGFDGAGNALAIWSRETPAYHVWSSRYR